MRIIILCSLLACHSLTFAQDALANVQEMFDNGLYESVIEYVHSFEIRHSEDLLLEADAYHKLKEYEMAISTYDRVLSRKKDNVLAYMRRGAANLELGEFGFALKDVKKALRLSPENPEANFHMGNICYDQGDLKNAVKFYRLAIAFRPKYPQAIYMLGAARSEQGQYKEAEKAFDQVLDEFPDATYNLAVVKLEAKKYTESLELFDKAEESGIETADLFFFRAESKFFLGDKHGACLDYKRAGNLNDEEALDIYDQYCMKSKKKVDRKRRDVIHMDF
ncbi:MAG: tetratricopeptide repeat protein [Flavobacteriales bacterium]|nr:tetratricopeptide repeat protein [Flavobacteriales bacterium]NNK81265.1 tetratricopeptide repeat protein [Flavobacteriales bacterium]